MKRRNRLSWLLLGVGAAALVAAPRAVRGGREGETVVVAAQPSWKLAGSDVELAVTRAGAHMAPVTFFRGTARPVQPYYVSPWQEEGITPPVPVLGPLRGDFFCMPFGGNAEAFNGEKHPPHGEVAGSDWSFGGVERSGGAVTMTLSLATKVRPGRVTRRVSLVDGHNAVYTRHLLEGYSGPMPLGHHATLAVPEAEGSLRVAVSPFQFGMTCPVQFGDPANREYQSFAVGKKFRDLRRVPLAWKEPAEADCTRFPARTGYTDLLAVFSETPRGGQPAWTAAVNEREGYLWFALKDPSVLPSTVFWISNRGRHGAPWNGRNRCLGLEDVCAYFAEGLVPSAGPNLLTDAGIRTAIELSPSRATEVNYIQGAARVPAGFGTVRAVEFEPGKAIFVSERGARVTAAVRHEFLRDGRLR